MRTPRLTLSEFLLLAQHEVQQVLEYLATPEARRESPELPAAVLATVGKLKLAVPVTFTATAGQMPQADPEEHPEAADAMVAERKEDHGRSDMTRRAAPRMRRLLVATPEDCRLGEDLGRIEVEFITCPKQYR